MKALQPFFPRALPPKPVTHEEFVQAIRDLVLSRSFLSHETRNEIQNAKLCYGAGPNGVRGITYYSAWQNGHPRPYSFVGVCGTGEESVTQLVGTTVHELAHVIAGHTAGHGQDWKAACYRLGLATAEAAGQAYAPEHFDAGFWAHVLCLSRPSDGGPAFAGRGAGLIPWIGLPTFRPRPCPMGIGTRGGKSRGVGSGSRLRLYHCACVPPVKVRAGSDTLNATCGVCGKRFNKV